MAPPDTTPITPPTADRALGCPPSLPFPSSAFEPFVCVATDPCSPDGKTTLWTFQPCSTTTTVAVAPTLPHTGAGPDLFTIGLALILVGVLLHRLCH